MFASVRFWQGTTVGLVVVWSWQWLAGPVDPIVLYPLLPGLAVGVAGLIIGARRGSAVPLVVATVLLGLGLVVTVWTMWDALLYPEQADPPVRTIPDGSV